MAAQNNQATVFGFSKKEFFRSLFKEWGVKNGEYKFWDCTIHFGYINEEGVLVVDDEWDNPLVIIKKGNEEVRFQVPKWFRARVRGYNGKELNSLTIGEKRYSAFRLAKIAAQAPETPGMLRIFELEDCRITGIFFDKEMEKTSPYDATILWIYVEPSPNPFWIKIPKHFSQRKTR